MNALFGCCCSACEPEEIKVIERALDAPVATDESTRETQDFQWKGFEDVAKEVRSEAAKVEREQVPEEHVKHSVQALEERVEEEVKQEAKLGTFKVELRKANGKDRWGFLVDEMQSGYMLLVVGFLEMHGLVQEYNRTAPEGMQLQKHDIILSVNGKTDSAFMLDALMVSREVSIVAARPRELTLTISKIEQDLGFSWKRSSDQAQAIYVTDGGVQPLVSSRDVIIGVNGKRGTAKELLAEASKGEAVDLQLLRLDP